MKNGRLIQKIRSMVTRGELDAAIHSLFGYSAGIEDRRLQDRIRILNGRYHKLEQMMDKDLIDLSYATSSKSRMKKEVLDILDRLEHVKGFSTPEVELVLEDETAELSAAKRRQLVLLVSQYLNLNAADVRMGNTKRG